MSCHYCEYTTQEPTTCPSCNDTTFLRKGIGTQQAVLLLQKLFPNARIARADLDSTKKKKDWQHTVTAMKEGSIDILVGTQTITKGYHFPRVTLVGIIWADLNLHFPMFNAAEVTLQQLIQVAGRAGRQTNESLVIIQTMDNHAIFQFVNELQYLSFYKEEITKRAMIAYPPCKRLVELELKHTNEMIIDKEAHDLVAHLQSINIREQLAIHILGPAKPPVHKIKNWYSRKIYIKGENIRDIIVLYKQIQQVSLQSFLYFTPQPSR
jgi:primosomal protein N' (replication factor Y)